MGRGSRALWLDLFQSSALGFGVRSLGVYRVEGLIMQTPVLLKKAMHVRDAVVASSSVCACATWPKVAFGLRVLGFVGFLRSHSDIPGEALL